MQAPIAVAESICNNQKEYTIWGGNEKTEEIRRNIQYAQYIGPDFYNKMILHVLQNAKNMNFKEFYNKTENRLTDAILSLWATGDKEMQDLF